MAVAICLRLLLQDTLWPSWWQIRVNWSMSRQRYGSGYKQTATERHHINRSLQGVTCVEGVGVVERCGAGLSDHCPHAGPRLTRAASRLPIASARYLCGAFVIT